MRTRVKICGITKLEDAQAACEAGADALGFVFVPASPRYIEPSLAAEIIAQLPAFVSSVGLFVNAPEAEVSDVLSLVPLDYCQYHGDESQDYCDSLGHPYIKAIRVRDLATVEAALSDYHSAAALLFDAYVPGLAGGTGESFDWQLFPKQAGRPCILAGGLSVDNVASAVQQVRPFAVDVSGGVERAKGSKDRLLIQRFINGVNSVNV